MGRRVAPDRGYAWVVLAASVGCNYLSGVLVYFVGVIHVELLDKFQEDVTITSWAGSVYSSLQMLTAPLASWVVNRYSCRVSVVAGGVMLCVGFVTSAFVTSVGQLVVTYGLIAGTGLGLTYSPSLMVVTFYFDKFRGLASGISVSGCALGILTGSLLTQAFIDMYTLKGAFLLIAGLGLQSSVFGMLYRPTHHDGGGGKKHGRHDNERRLSWKACDEGSETQHGRHAPEDEHRVSWKACDDGSETPASLKDGPKDCFLQEVLVSNEDHEPAFVIIESGQNVAEDLEEKVSESKQTSPLVRSQTEATGSAQNSGADCVKVEEEEGMDCASNLLNNAEKHNVEASVGTTPSKHEASKRTASQRSRLPTCVDRFSGLGPLMKNWAFLLHCASILFANINMGGVYLHLPQYARTHGTQATQVAALFVGVGVFSLISRIGSGVLLMSPRVNGFALSVGLMGTCGLASCLFPLYSSTYVGQMVFASLFGLSTGGFYTLINVLTVELVDVELLPAAYGALIFVMGIGYLAGPPLSGLIVDNGGTYEHSFIFLGMTMFASAAFDLSAKIIHRRKNAHDS